MKIERKMHDILLEAITTTNSYDEWVKFIKDFVDDKISPALKELMELFEETPQGLKWHPEFELSKHVYLVSISVHRQGRDDLLEAAFLHDIGKIYSTNIGNDRIYSYGHAEISAEYIGAIRDYLKYPELTHKVIEKHMDYWDMGDPRIKNELHLKEFVKADKAMSEVLFYEFFFNEAEENKIKEEEVYRKQRESDKKVYIAIGISGSGKSTYLRKNFREEVIVCPDEIRRKLCGDISDQSKNSEIWNETRIEMRSIIDKYGEVVLDATNVDKYRRVKFMSAFNGCRKIALVFPVELDEAIARVQKDIEDGIDRSKVPAKVIKRQHGSFNKGLTSLIHEFNEMRVVATVGEQESITLEIVKKLDEAKKENENE